MRHSWGYEFIDCHCISCRWIMSGMVTEQGPSGKELQSTGYVEYALIYLCLVDCPLTCCSACYFTRARGHYLIFNTGLKIRHPFPNSNRLIPFRGTCLIVYKIYTVCCVENSTVRNQYRVESFSNHSISSTTCCLNTRKSFLRIFRARPMELLSKEGAEMADTPQ